MKDGCSLDLLSSSAYKHASVSQTQHVLSTNTGAGARRCVFVNLHCANKTPLMHGVASSHSLDLLFLARFHPFYLHPTASPPPSFLLLLLLHLLPFMQTRGEASLIFLADRWSINQ